MSLPGEIIMSVVEFTSAQLEEEGLLYCDGSYVNQSDYPDLYSAIGTEYGSGSYGLFRLPDFRNVYLKGKVSGRDMHKVENSQNKSHVHSVDAPETGCTTWNENAVHDHNLLVGACASGSGAQCLNLNGVSSEGFINVENQTHAHTFYLNIPVFDSGSEGGTNVEVRNYQVYYYIRSGKDLLKQFFDAVTKKTGGVYDFTRMFPWTIGVSPNDRVVYLTEQLRQVLCYNYGGLV